VVAVVGEENAEESTEPQVNAPTEESLNEIARLEKRISWL